MQIDLKKLGINDYGNIENQEGLGKCSNDKLELYFNKTVSQCLDSLCKCNLIKFGMLPLSYMYILVSL